MRKIETIQKKLLDENTKRPIRMQGLLRKRKETLKEFLVKFFTKFNDENDTIYVDDKSVQTDTERRRSIGDIYRIVVYYYPNATLEQVTKLLYEDLKNELPNFRSSYCSTIHKRVFYVGEEDELQAFLNGETEDEHEMKIEQWKRQIKK